jgi:hypothetical protein
MSYYAVVRSTTLRPFTAEEIDAYIEQAGDSLPEGFEPATLTTVEYGFQTQGPFKKYKQAFRAVTPMLDELVPHEANRGLVMTQHPDQLPMSKMDLPPKPKRPAPNPPATGYRPPSLNKAIHRVFWVKPETVAFLRKVEHQVAMGLEVDPRPSDLRERAYDLALERGQARADAAPPPKAEPRRTMKLPCNPDLLSRDVARKAASLLEISGRGKMRVGDLRNAIGTALREGDYLVEITPGCEPELS